MGLLLLLQETHLSDAEHDKKWADEVYFSSHTSGRTRGIAILIHRSSNFTHTYLQIQRCTGKIYIAKWSKREYSYFPV